MPWLVLPWLAVALMCAPVRRAQAAPERLSRPASFVDDVNEAIDSGAKWLLKEQKRDGGFGTYGGYPTANTAISYLTLRVCGIPRSDRRMKRAYTALRREYVGARDSDQLRTYTAALTMMAIEEHGRGDVNASAKKSRYRKDGERTTHLDEPDLEWMRELVRFMEGNQATNGGWRYGQAVKRYKRARNGNDYDHSNTQYALLGLKSASRSGVDVDPKVYERALKHLLDAQQRKGPAVQRVSFAGKKETFARATDHARGWGYFALTGTGTRNRRPRGFGGAYGSMTAGSLGAVVICRSELLGWKSYSKRLDAKAETSVWDGIAWLGDSFAVDQNPGMGGWHYYYLYALERAGVLAGVDWMGEHDWYGEGAGYLLSVQHRDGAWMIPQQQLLSTCFALLFLKKGTIPVSRGAVTPSGAADSIDFDAAHQLSGKDLDDFVDLVISRWSRAATDYGRAALRRGTASVGPKVILPLLRRMGAGNDRQRAPAHAVLVAITGQTYAFDPAAPAEARFDALMPWEEWYMARTDRLAFNAKTGSLVTR